MKKLPLWLKINIFGFIYTLLGVIMYIYPPIEIGWGLDMIIMGIFFISSWPWVYLFSMFFSEQFIDLNLLFLMVIGNILTIGIISLIIKGVNKKSDLLI